MFRGRDKMKFSSKKIRKIGENGFYSVAYLLSFVIGMLVLRDESANWKVNLLSNDRMMGFWESITDQDTLRGRLEPPTGWVRPFYLGVSGFWLGCAVSHFAIDTRRSDFMEFVVHHLSTLLLLLVSYVLGYVRFGLVILPLHDCTDILLYGAKTVHYMGISGVDTAIFFAFTVCFLVTRLILYPRLVYGIFLEPFLILAENPTYNFWARYWPVYIAEYVVVLSALFILQVLHCYWFGLVLKILEGELSGRRKVSEEGDARSDDEDD
uniref:TLC domain-containing protein n=1 Tax=Compsopogon caeruleus TaxID=31354 RepID=A0A7S1TH34_9RHOD